MDMLNNWFNSQGFMPHGHCFLSIPSILWTSVVADALIALAYLTIPVTLIYFIRRRRDMPFNWMFVAFGVFILACGSTHLAEIWVVWRPDYVPLVILKAITAVASVVTAIALVRLVPLALLIPVPPSWPPSTPNYCRPTRTCAPRWSAPKWPTAPSLRSWPR